MREIFCTFAELFILWYLLFSHLPAQTLCMPPDVAYMPDEFWPRFNAAGLLVAIDDSMKTLPVGLAALSGQFGTDYGAQMAGALLSLLPVLAVFFALQRYFIRGLTAGALKE